MYWAMYFESDSQHFFLASSWYIKTDVGDSVLHRQDFTLLQEFFLEQNAIATDIKRTKFANNDADDDSLTEYGISYIKVNYALLFWTVNHFPKL